MSENAGVLVYCEVIGDKLAPVATELLGAGSRLATELGQELSAALILVFCPSVYILRQSEYSM